MADSPLMRPTGGNWLTTEEAAAMIGISAQTLSNWRAAKIEGRPLSYKLGSRVWYKRADIEAWIENQREAE